MARAKQRLGADQRPPEVRVEIGGGNAPAEIRPAQDDRDGGATQLMEAFGTLSPQFCKAELERLYNILHGAMKPVVSEQAETQVNAALAVVSSTKPQNEVEAILACQMAATHVLAMDCLGRAARSTTASGLQMYANLATKLQRTFLAQVEALSKIRRGGEQKVTVEHVHVYPGGQAIVGLAKSHSGGDGS